MVRRKRGVSPVVATVLLIAIVVVVISIIFLWGRSVIKENVQKQDKPAEQACSEINLQVSCSGGILSVTNLGNIPVYTMNIRINDEGSTLMKQAEQNSEVGIGGSQELDLGDLGITGCPEDYEVIPVILGTVEGAKKAYVCSNNGIRE